MKFIGATIFIFLLVTQIFSKWLVVIDYTINQKLIAERLCENRDKPILHCDGKCQLAKKLAAEEDQNNKANSGNSIGKISFSEVIVDDLFSGIPSAGIISATSFNDFYLANIPATLPSSIFHPPLV